MMNSEPYQLLDFGQGRKLERFGQFLLDRPSPAAEGTQKSRPQVWRQADARFERSAGERGSWRPAGALPEAWTLERDPCRLQLRPTPFGHVGVFPEQFTNWQWLQRQTQRSSHPLRILNLFAYTGGSTLAAAAAGAEVVHVDAARNVVRWARGNAQMSGLQAAPIRWIVEDAQKFVSRELRRGSQYNAVILDPPSYGHGPKRETWKLSLHLLPLLRACAQLTARQRAFVLLTCHSPGYEPAELSACLAEAFYGHCRSDVFAQPMNLTAADGRRLDAGVVAHIGSGP